MQTTNFERNLRDSEDTTIFENCKRSWYVVAGSSQSDSKGESFSCSVVDHLNTVKLKHRQNDAERHNR